MDTPEKQCPICYEDFPDLTRMCRNSTLHEACAPCVQRLKEQNTTCAVCRGPLHDHVYPTLTHSVFMHMVQIDMAGWTQRDWEVFHGLTDEERGQLFNLFLSIFRRENPNVIVRFRFDAVGLM